MEIIPASASPRQACSRITIRIGTHAFAAEATPEGGETGPVRDKRLKNLIHQAV